MQITITKESGGQPLKNSVLASDKDETITIKLQHPTINPDDYDFMVSIKLNESDPDSSALLLKSTGDNSGITKNLISLNILEAQFSVDAADLLKASSNTFFYNIQMFMSNPESIRTIQKGQFNLKPNITEDTNQWISQV